MVSCDTKIKQIETSGFGSCLRWFHETRKSNKLKPEVSAPGWVRGPGWRLQPDLPPKAANPAGVSAPALGPNQEPNTSGFNFLIFEFREYHVRQEPNTWGFNFLILVSHEYHLRFSSFHVKIFVNTRPNFLTTQWNPGHKIKKICAVFIEIPHWWFFAKNTAVTSVYSYKRFFLFESYMNCFSLFDIMCYFSSLFLILQ